MSSPALRAALIATLLLLAFASLALGHSELESATPGPDETVTELPAELVGRFTQDLDAERSSVEIRDATGTTLARGQRDPERVRVMRATLPVLPPGEYMVRWLTLSTEDGELARGTYRFTVAAAPSPAVSVPPVASPSAAPGSSQPPTSPPASATAAPSATPSAPPSPVPSASPAPGAGSGGDAGEALVPIAAALLVAGAAGIWLLRRKPS